MRRTGHRWLLAVLAAVIVLAACTDRSDGHHDPTPQPPVFTPIADRAETGNSDYLGDVATDQDTAVIVGAAYNGSIIPTFGCPETLERRGRRAGWTTLRQPSPGPPPTSR